MNLLKVAGLLALLLAATVASAQSAQADVAITLERTACFGACPVYTVTILEDGTVLYNGQRFVDITGEQTGQIDPETVALMVDVFANAGYFAWDNDYTNMTITDQPYITTSVTRDGETHQVRRYAGDASAPLALPFLEAWVDAMANTAQWTGTTPEPDALLFTTELPMISLRRDPCFGFCPVDTVTLFGDGTVIYTGINHVDALGVHVLQADPDEVAWIAQLAELSGYFDWQDQYDLMIVTDLPTYTTSIRTDDNTKRIVRYDGDPNAPVGLVRIETMIVELVERLMAR